MNPKLDLIGFVTTDMAATVAFYRLLGLAFPDGVESEQHIECTLPNGLRVAFDTVDTIKSFDPNWTTPSGGRGVSPAFLCESPAEVDSLFDRLIASGAKEHLAPWDAFWGQRYATVLDPGGNAVDLFAALPAQK